MSRRCLFDLGNCEIEVRALTRRRTPARSSGYARRRRFRSAVAPALRPTRNRLLPASHRLLPRQCARCIGVLSRARRGATNRLARAFARLRRSDKLARPLLPCWRARAPRASLVVGVVRLDDRPARCAGRLTRRIAPSPALIRGPHNARGIAEPAAFMRSSPRYDRPGPAARRRFSRLSAQATPRLPPRRRARTLCCTAAGGGAVRVAASEIASHWCCAVCARAAPGDPTDKMTVRLRHYRHARARP